MRALLCAICILSVQPAEAQERFRVGANLGQQATSTPLVEEQTFQQYFEQGSFTLERTVPKALFFEGSVMVRLWRGLHAGAAVSRFKNTGDGELTARVPHPLQFDQQRTVTGPISDVTRREIGQHISAGWAFPAAGGLDFMILGGPSVFMAEQMFVTTLMHSLDKEVYPFDEIDFPGAVTEQRRESVIGYHVGVDMTRWFTRRVGVGLLVRYATGKKDFTPTGGTPVEVKVGGLHAGGGLRLVF